MKQGNKFLLPVTFSGIELSSIEKCEFVLTQGDVRLEFTYPSTRTQLLTDAIGLIWEPEETYLFEADKQIKMDTRVKVAGSAYNPDTNIVTLTMAPSLFKKV